jgi:hypothetical protein
VDLPPFSWAEFWNIALWGPLTQETVAFLKRAAGDRSGVDQIAGAAAATAEQAGVGVDLRKLRGLLVQDRLLEALVARDFATLDAMVGPVVRRPAGWTAAQASAVLVAGLGLAVGRTLPADRQLDLAAQRVLAAKLDQLQAWLAELGAYARAEVDLLGELNQRIAELPAEVGRQVRPVGYRDDYDSVIAAFEQRHLPGLRDREVELMALLQQIEEGPGYLAVEGEMYAGKTALFTALRRRLVEAGYSVVAYFIQRGFADSPADFLPKIITQLLQLLEATDSRLAAEGVATTLDARRTQFIGLWQQSTQTAQQPVVLLVDALDEQLHRRNGGGLFISQLLPTDVGLQGRVVVSSRPNPDFAAVVPPDHPLAILPGHRRVALAPSPHAIVEREKIRRELDQYLTGGDPDAERLTGMYAIGAAPLSDNDLADFFNFTPGQVVALRKPLASSLLRFHDPDGIDRFTLGHEAQRQHVRDHLTAWGIRRLTDEVLSWADRYAEQGWPDDTPSFLRDYLHAFLSPRRGQIGLRDW